MKLYKVVPVLAIAALTISMQLSTSCNRQDTGSPLADLARVTSQIEGATPSGTSPTRRLDVLAYNVFLRPDPVAWGDENTCRAGAIGDALVERARDLDIVALNESFEPPAVDRLVERLGDHFPYRALQQPQGDWLEFNGGLSLLSKHPIRELYSETFEECAFADCMTAKGFLHAVIEVSSSSKVNVVTTHLDAGDSTWDRRSRRRQIEKLRTYMNERNVGEKWPTILLGDLNVDGIDGAAGRLSDRRPTRGEYGDMLAQLAPPCEECTAGACPDSCNRRPTDAMAAGRSPWQFTAEATQGLNSLNCMDQSLAPCRSPNSREHWQHRERLDYVLTFPASGSSGGDLQIRRTEYLPFRSDACGTRYLSDHKAIRAELELPAVELASGD